MGLVRGALLWASQNHWLRDRFPRYRFVRRTAARFMPGADLEDALAAAHSLKEQGIGAVFTHLGENVSSVAEAEAVTRHYLNALDCIRSAGLKSDLSVKLTHLGLDISSELCQSNVEKVVQCAEPDSVVWIDMEASSYVDRTLGVYRRIREHYHNVGICLQAYLYRTAKDLDSLLPLGPAIRLVKGAYHEPPERAFTRKKDVDVNFFALAKRLLGKDARNAGVRAAIATHDQKMVGQIEAFARSEGLTGSDFEFQMLYGIQRDEQLRLVKEGWHSRVLISYGAYWFPWFMRRLAERPANMAFLARNLF